MVPQVPENKAMVIYGRRTRMGEPGYRVFTEGGRSPMPIIESAEMMDIGPQTIEMDLRDVKVVADGVDRMAHVEARAVVRISDHPEAIMVAAEHLLHVNQSDVGRMARNLFEAHLRGVLMSNPFEEAKDKIRTGIMVKDLMGKDLMRIGVAVDELVVHQLKLRDGTPEVV